MGSSKRPAFDGEGTFAAGEFDRGTHERVRHALASVLTPDEEAREKPDAVVLGAFPMSEDLASSADGDGVSRPRTAGAPTDRLASHRGQDPHRRRVDRGHSFEAMPVATTEPTSGELATGQAERHAPAVPSIPLALEQVRKIRQISRSHGPGVDIGSHEWEATATTSGRRVDVTTALSAGRGAPGARGGSAASPSPPRTRAGEAAANRPETSWRRAKRHRTLWA